MCTDAAMVQYGWMKLNVLVMRDQLTSVVIIAGAITTAAMVKMSPFPAIQSTTVSFSNMYVIEHIKMI